jgi:uncharacterized protein YjbI with pentapeptide repeats
VVREKSIPILSGAITHLGGVFFRNDRVQQYVPPLMSKYEAHMFKANLKGANLSLTKMNGVDLGEADLSGAIVTKEQLETVKSLKGATLSDGSIHP